MANTKKPSLEAKKRYFMKNRLKNFIASSKLDGIDITSNKQKVTKSKEADSNQICEKDRP